MEETPRNGRGNKGGQRSEAQMPMDHEHILERVHTNLYNLVGQAAAAIAHHELGWSQQELVKRVVRYIYSSAKDPALLSLHWEQVAKTIVQHTMATYSTACQERPWFWELQLHHAFASCVWEIACSRGRQRASYQEVEEFVNGEFESQLDNILLTKALWEAAERTFKDEAVCGKVYRALHNTYKTVLDECLVDSRPLGDLQRVQHFTKRWAEDAMQRAWTSIPDSERVLTEGNVSRLFQNLIAPFGDAHDFSCIPQMLYEKIGRPPRNWGFIRTIVTQLFATWKQVGAASDRPSKRRRKGGNGGAENDDVPDQSVKDAAEFNPDDIAEEAKEVELAGSEAPEGIEGADATVDMVDMVDEPSGGERKHAECTSEQDCVGFATDSLVRHMLDGDPGDIYCQSCWAQFVTNNTDLVGVFEDGEKATQKFTL